MLLGEGEMKFHSDSGGASSPGPKRRFLSFIRLPNWQRWSAFFIVLIILFIIFAPMAHRFLAVTQRVMDADTLVVEEWSADVVGQAAVDEFKKGNYIRLLISCLREDLRENAQSHAQKSPEINRLVALGIPKEKILECYSPVTNNRQSASMALGVRDTLRKLNMKSKGVNVMAPATHARKTWLVHRRALFPETSAGIIAVQPDIYNPNRWWLNGKSAKWVLKNYIGLLYEWATGM